MMSRFAPTFFPAATVFPCATASSIEAPATFMEHFGPSDYQLAGKLGLSLFELENLYVHHRKQKIWRDVYGFTRLPEPAEWTSIDIRGLDEAAAEAAELNTWKEETARHAWTGFHTMAATASAISTGATMPASVPMERSALNIPSAVPMERLAAIYTPQKPKASWTFMERPTSRQPSSEPAHLSAPPMTTSFPGNIHLRASARRMQQARDAKARSNMPGHIQAALATAELRAPAMERCSFSYSDGAADARRAYERRFAAKKEAQLFEALEKSLAAAFKQTHIGRAPVCPPNSPALFCPSEASSSHAIFDAITAAFDSVLFVQNRSQVLSPVEITLELADEDEEDPAPKRGDSDSATHLVAPPNTPVVKQEGADPASGALGLTFPAPSGLITRISVAPAFVHSTPPMSSPTERSTSSSETDSAVTPSTPEQQRAVQEWEYCEERQAVLSWRLKTVGQEAQME